MLLHLHFHLHLLLLGVRLRRRVLLRLDLLLKVLDVLVKDALDVLADPEPGHAELEHLEHQRYQLRRTLPDCRSGLQERGHTVQELAAFVLDSSIVGDRHAGCLNVDAPAQFFLVALDERHCWLQECLILGHHRLHVRHLENLLRVEVLTDDVGLDLQDFLGKPGHILLKLLDADAGILGLEFLRTKCFTGLRVAAHHVTDAGEYVDLCNQRGTVRLQLLQSIDDGIEREKVDLSFQATLLGKHGPIIHRDKRVVVALGEHALNTISTPVVDPDDLASDDEQADAVIHLVEFVVLILQHRKIRLRQTVGCGQVGEQRLGARLKATVAQLEEITAFLQNLAHALGEPDHFPAFTIPNLVYAAALQHHVGRRVAVWQIVVLVRCRIQGHLLALDCSEPLGQLVAGHIDLPCDPTAFLIDPTGRVDQVLEEHPVDGHFLTGDLLHGFLGVRVDGVWNVFDLGFKAEPRGAKPRHQTVEHRMAHHGVEVTVGLVHILIDAPLEDDAPDAGHVVVHVEKTATHVRLGGLVVEAGLHDPDVSEEHVVPTLLHLGGIPVVDVTSDGQPRCLPKFPEFLFSEGDFIFPTLVDAIRFSFKLLEAGDSGGGVLSLHRWRGNGPGELTSSLPQGKAGVNIKHTPISFAALCTWRRTLLCQRR